MTIIYFLLMLTVLVFIHELGHFIFAKRCGTHVHEFSIGFGPKIFSFKRKNDETQYSFRLFLIGGYVRIAGEDMNIPEDADVPEEKRFYKKSKLNRFLVLVAGATFNFIFALILYFIIGVFNGSTTETLVISDMLEDYPAYNSELEVGDKILSINGNKVTSYNEVVTLNQIVNKDGNLVYEVLDNEGNTKKVTITPKYEELEKTPVYMVGIVMSNEIEHGIVPALKYSFHTFATTINTMRITIINLFTGNLNVKSMSGAVGIYGVIDEISKPSDGSGFFAMLSFTALFSINLGFINLLPFPALDGGRILFLIIEAIRRKPVSAKVETYFHAVGFILLMILMVVVTYNDIIKLL